MSLTVVWKTYQPNTIARGYWDQGMLEELFAGKWNVPLFREFKHVGDFEALDPGEGAVVVVPSRHNAIHIDRLNADLASLPWVVLILTGDEEYEFDWTAVRHPNLKMWLAQPNPHIHPQDTEIQYLGSGYPPHAREHLKKSFDIQRDKTFFFSGQDTHSRRHECLEVLRRYGEANGTPGFTQGLAHDEYYAGMVSGRLSPCPSGPTCVDTFRLFESLEAGCIPVADTQTPSTAMRDHWRMVFGEVPPFPTVDEWSEFPDYLPLASDERWTGVANSIGAWWEKKKRDLAIRLHNDLDVVGAPPATPRLGDRISVVMVTSPVASHPSLDLIRETINSIRLRLPDSEIFILCDGVRSEQEHYRADYEEYVSRLLWKARNEWTNVIPVVFDNHIHQAAMVMELMKRHLLRTELMLFVEHDTPLHGEIPFEVCADFISSGQGDVVRFHHEAIIPAEHEYLYPNGWVPGEFEGEPFLRTIQWSQRPHLAKVSFYRDILFKYFSPQGRTMIEDTMHGAAQAEDFQGSIYVYYPPDDCKRSLHSDGRGDDPKYEMEP